MGVNDAGEMLEVAKEECGRLEREVANLRAAEDLVNSEHAAVVEQLKLTAAEDLVYVRRIEAERDTAIAQRDASRQVNAEFLAARSTVVADHEVCTQESEKLKRRVDHWANASESYAWTVEAVRAARSNHPECTEHPDGDVISCGWKRAVLDIDAALAKLPTDTLAAAHMADLQRQNAVYAASPMNEGLGE